MPNIYLSLRNSIFESLSIECDESFEPFIPTILTILNLWNYIGTCIIDNVTVRDLSYHNRNGILVILSDNCFKIIIQNSNF